MTVTVACVCSAATPNVWVNRRSTGSCSPSLLFCLSKYQRWHLWYCICVWSYMEVVLHILAKSCSSRLLWTSWSHCLCLFDWLTDVTRWTIIPLPNISWPCASHITTWVRVLIYNVEQEHCNTVLNLLICKETPFFHFLLKSVTQL